MWEFLMILWHCPRTQFMSNFGRKRFFFLFNFTRIMWFFWDLRLMLSDTPKGNIFGFLAVHWVPNWTKTVNFGRISFESKCKILKDFSNTVYLIRYYLWTKLQKVETIFWGVRAQKKKQKGIISWMLNQYKKIWKFLTSQLHMLYWRNLPQLRFLISSFIWQDPGT